MEEEALKRYTDCVYFLASPLTCIKGIECEYRHSEIARLNPRDCWYWLAGNCFNPSCAFRHPPLKIHTELSSEYAPSQNQHSNSMKKVEVPCHFYFNGFCKKGDKCLFLHGPNDALKVSNTAAAINDAPNLENKTCTRSNIASAVIEKNRNSSEAAPKISTGSQIKPKEGVNKSNFKCGSASPNTSASEFEELPADKLDAFLGKEGSIKSESEIYTDHSSEEEVEVDTYLNEDEDWLESSPGFDGIVDNKSQNLGNYENDADYVVGNERYGGELDGNFLEYNYEDCNEYAEALHEERRFNSCVEFDDEIDEQRLDILRNISRCDDEKINFHRNLILESNFLPVSLPIDSLRDNDLRSYLERGREDNYLRQPYFSERNYSTPNIYRCHENFRQYGRQRHSFRKNENKKRRFKAINSSGRIKKSQPTISRQQFKKKRPSKRPVYSSDISKRPVRRERVTEEYLEFSGPKTLDQIKKEKRKGTGISDLYGNSGRFSKKSENFQGPKPLSEILKEKGKIRSVVDGNNGSS